MNKHYINQCVRNFKSDLIKCHYNNAKLIKLNEQLIEVEVKLYEVSATTYEEKTGLPDAYKTPKLHEIQRHEDLLREVAILRLHFDKMSEQLDRLDEPISRALIRHYIYEMDMVDVAETQGISRQLLQHRIDRELIKLFTEEK